MYIFIDTETSGFPSPKRGAATQAWVCQLAARIHAEDGHALGGFNAFIKPDGRYMHPSAIQAHGMTAEFLEAEGLYEQCVAKSFESWLIDNSPNISYTIAHNIDYDMPMLNYMMARAGKANLLLNYPQFCTMKHTVDLCCLPQSRSYGKQKYKWPKLSELYRYLFNTDFENAHNAMADVSATADCFFTPPVQEIFRSWRDS